MSTTSPSSLQETAIRAIRALHHSAVMDGSADAAVALHEVATYANGSLADFVHNVHPSHPHNELTQRLPAFADSWPMSVPAIEEARSETAARYIPETFGDSLPYRAKQKAGKGAARKPAPGSRFDFAIVMMNRIRELGIAVPAEITTDTAQAWENAGLRVAEVQCGGNWWSYPHPKIIEESVRKAKTGDRKCNTPRTVIISWLKAGFAQLSREPSPGEI